jgi:hypothetical protein
MHLTRLLVRHHGLLVLPWILDPILADRITVVAVFVVFVVLVKVAQKTTSTSATTTVILPPPGALFFHSMYCVRNIERLFESSDTWTPSIIATAASSC